MNQEVQARFCEKVGGETPGQNLIILHKIIDTLKRLVFILLLSTLNYWTYSCNCIGELTVKESIKHSDIVVTGTVISSGFMIVTDSNMIKLFKPDTSLYNKYPYSIIIAKYRIKVEKLFKGKITSDTLTIYTGLGNGDCGFNFKIGYKYIIYGQNKHYKMINSKFNFPYGPNICWTDICTRTTTFNIDEFNKINNLTKKKH